MSAHPRREAALQRVSIAGEGSLPSLAALFHKTVDIAGSGKRKIDGEYAATRLKQAMTSKWANERFRQVMLLVRQFRMEWPNQTLLTADDTEFIRSAVDIALSTAAHEGHTADIYDLNSTTWAIWMVQHVYAVRKGAWTADAEQAQHSLTFENLYDFLETQHARGDNFNVTEEATKRLLHRYKLPFKKMTVPPKPNELFKWKKGAKRLSDWMVMGGFAPIDEDIGSLKPPTLVAPPPLQDEREARREAMWQRVAGRARVRTLTSVGGDGEDATLTRSVVRSVMDDSRANEPEMTDEETDAFVLELEAELEEQQAPGPPSQAAASSSGHSPDALSEYELERLRNIARNQQVLAGLGLADGAPLGPPPAGPSHAPARDPYPPGRSGAAPTRRSTIVREARSYPNEDEEVAYESDEDMWEPAEGTSASTGVVPPGAVVLNLVSSDDEGYALLSPDPTRRGGLYIAPSTVQIERGQLAGNTLGEPGLFTIDAIRAGAFICMYTGTFRSSIDFERLPTARRDQLSRYAVEVDAHDIVITPDVNVTSGKVNFRRHSAAAANEPSASNVANAFTQASVVEAYGHDDAPSSYLIVCIFTCRPVAAGGEILWNYGEGYDELRQEAGYAAGRACPEEIIDRMTLPPQNARVEAILAKGDARAQEAIYKLADGSSEESSGDEWVPVKRVARAPRGA
eukprot:scaffold17938_cov61-Phaeocystis_antarctica.AAC.2